MNEPPDDEAWQAILDQYRRLVYHWLGDLASDDAVQEVFLGFWQAQRIARRLGLDELRGGFLKGNVDTPVQLVSGKLS